MINVKKVTKYFKMDKEEENEKLSKLQQKVLNNLDNILVKCAKEDTYVFEYMNNELIRGVDMKMLLNNSEILQKLYNLNVTYYKLLPNYRCYVEKCDFENASYIYIPFVGESKPYFDNDKLMQKPKTSVFESEIFKNIKTKDKSFFEILFGI